MEHGLVNNTAITSASELELCKENIQPLRQGRNASSLRTALRQRSDDSLMQEKRAFEAELRTYAGDDPLDVWYRYILWVEQYFPKGGKEGSLLQLIEKCLMKFKDVVSYHNDKRYIEIWLKYANLNQNPMEVYEAMWSNNIGCSLAAFYEQWAWQSERIGNIKHANFILSEGLRRKAEPAERLVAAQSQFQMRLAAAFAQDGSSVPQGTMFQPEYEQRAYLGTLKPHGKKHSVTVNRISSLGPGSRSIISNTSHHQVLGNQGKEPFQVFNDENASPNIQPAIGSVAARFAPQDERSKENILKPGKWTKAKVHDRASRPVAFGALGMIAKTSFAVFQDDGLQQPSMIPQCPAKLNHVLSEKQDDYTPPVAIFEPPDDTKRSMYCKSKVYGGAEEYSFEEIRAAKWFKKKKQKDKMQQNLKMKEELVLWKEKCAKLEQLILQSRCRGAMDDNLTMQLQELLSLRPNVQPSPQAPEQSCQQAVKDPVNNICGLPVIKVTNCGSISQGSNIPVEGESYTTSPTCCSRETYSIVREMFNGTLGIGAGSLTVDEISSTPEGEQQIHAASRGLRSQPPFAIFVDPNPGLPEVVSKVSTEEKDANAVDSSGTCDASLSLKQPLTACVSPNHAEEDKENAPPRDYCQPQIVRQLAGILEPSAVLPVEPQEEETSDDDLKGIVPLPPDKIVDETKFSELDNWPPMAGVFASTPFLQKSSAMPLAFPHDELTSIFATVTLPTMTCPATETLREPKQTIAISQYAHQDPLPPLCLETSCAADMCSSENEIFKTPSSPTRSAKERLPAPRSIPNARSWRTENLSPVLEQSRECSKSSSSGSSGQSSTFGSAHAQLQQTLGSRSQCGTLSSAKKSASSALLNSHRCNGLSAEDSERCPSPSLPNNVVARELCHTEHQTDIDPFSNEVINLQLQKLACDINSHPKYQKVEGKLPSVKPGSEIIVGNVHYWILSAVAEGAYSKIFCAMALPSECNTEPDLFLLKGNIVLKVCKGGNKWEFYICTQIQQRLEKIGNSEAHMFFMDISNGIFFDDGCILKTQLAPYGTLLDLVNTYRRCGEVMPECLVLYFTLELLLITIHLHQCQIIHADIKPDNIVVMDLHSVYDLGNPNQKTTCLKLIDFGRAIDMTLFPRGTEFSVLVTTDGFQCPEMKEGRPWTYQTDFYGILGSIHVMLFGDYMSVQKGKHGEWTISSRFKRYWKGEFWEPLFHTLLNVPGCSQQPDLWPFVHQLQQLMKTTTYQKELRNKNYLLTKAYNVHGGFTK